LILSWTPNEYRDFLRGAQHRQADQREDMALSALFNRYAQNAKQARLKRMFDADMAHRRIDKGMSNWKESRSPRLTSEMFSKMKSKLNQSLNTFKKGG
jgi:hypothetical protein